MRWAHFDRLKGMLIVLVVAGHVINPITSTHFAMQVLATFIWTFHMPCFLFVSGLFSKGAFRGGYFKVERLLYYVVLAFCLYASTTLLCLVLGQDRVFNPFTMNGTNPAWYLMVLAQYTLLVPALSYLRVGVALPITLLFGCAASAFSLGDVFAASRAITYLPFFVAGYYCEPMRIVEFVKKRKGRHLIAALVVCVALFVGLARVPLDGLGFLKGVAAARNSIGELLAWYDLPFEGVLACVVFRAMHYVAAAALCMSFLIIAAGGGAFWSVWAGEHSRCTACMCSFTMR